MGGCQRAGGGGELGPQAFAGTPGGEALPRAGAVGRRISKWAFLLQKKPPPPPPAALPKAPHAAHTGPGGPLRPTVNMYSRKAGNKAQPKDRLSGSSVYPLGTPELSRDHVCVRRGLSPARRGLVL